MRNTLGLMYYCGQGVPEDYVQACIYFEQIIANPDIDPRVTADARNTLGGIYYVGGHGVPQDYEQARTYFEQVVANPDIDPQVTAKARNTLGLMYYCGLGVPQDYAQACIYFEQIIANPDIELPSNRRCEKYAWRHLLCRRTWSSSRL